MSRTINYQSRCSDVDDFLDGTYSDRLRSHDLSAFDYAPRLDWARIGLEKMTDRIIPRITGPSASNYDEFLENIIQVLTDAIKYGNSTLIINADGSMRVSDYSYGFARLSPTGEPVYLEAFDPDDDDAIGSIIAAVGSGSKIIAGSTNNGELLLNTKAGNVSTGAKTFTIFNNATYRDPYGRTRITQPIMTAIEKATRNEVRLEAASELYSMPQRVILNIWDGLMNEEIGGSQQLDKLRTGIGRIVAFPARPNPGPDDQDVKIQQLDPSDLKPLLNYKDACAREVASSFNIDITELGVAGEQGQSAEALVAAKEDLIVEIVKFEATASRTIETAMMLLANIYHDDEKPRFTWGQPATPSLATSADFFAKMAKYVPGMASNAQALQLAGMPEDLANDIAAGRNGLADGGDADDLGQEV